MTKITRKITKNGKIVDQDFASFEIESTILKELGEQLVSNSVTALTELIKNGYDADATVVDLSYDESMITIEDNGHGMSEDDFLNKWMKVGTSNKVRAKESKNYQRNLSGSKGVGRFAVQFLGEKLKLITVSKDDSGKKNKLVANFDWNKITETKDLEAIEIAYEYSEGVSDSVGTILIITGLKQLDDFRNSVYKVRSNLLNMVSPLQPIIIDLGYKICGKKDPGFNFTVSNLDDLKDEVSIGSAVLSKYVARAEVRYISKDNKLVIRVYHKDESSTFKFEVRFESGITQNVIADIRFFPRRKGVFSDLKDINGTKAYGWINDHHGIGVYDRGFRVLPYGLGNNDWLYQDVDMSVSKRVWRSELMENNFPMPEDIRQAPKLNYMLNLPRSLQVVGAVFVESGRERGGADLKPNMDRQGFRENKAYEDLVEINRFAIECIAMVDKKNIIRRDQKERIKKQADTRKDIQAFIKIIKKTASLSPEDKATVIDQYQYLHKNIEELEDYDRQSRESLEIVGLMGVIAGFMTHEYQGAIDTLEEASATLAELGKKDKLFLEHKDSIDKNVQYFSDYIEYTRAFVTSLRQIELKRYVVKYRIDLVTQTFGGYCKDKSIRVDTSEISDALLSPYVPVALYQGIIHNLFTNSIKALISEVNDDRVIRIIVWNEGTKTKKHVIQVMDNGPGIPYALQSRIWDPLFTTTSNENNPLGSGMGLGLSLLKKVIKNYKGMIDLVEPPKGYSTCFRVELPYGK